tara:strand:- start:46 stop:687 length:642 start_codon:yes stop_codon:yes gene_type:complete
LEVKAPHIADIYVPEIYVPEIYQPSAPLHKPEIIINPVGCTYQHRDIENTGNRNLLIDDPNGVFTVCDSVFPSFNPIDYTPKNLIITEEPPTSDYQPEIPKTEPPTTKTNTKKEKEVIIPPCPSQKDQRVGDFRNDKRIERVVGHKRGQDGIECITIYEDVPFTSQYIPEIPSLVSTAVIGLVAASSPLLLNAVKPIVKQIIKKLTKKKDKVK